MASTDLEIRGAREHNLRNLSLSLPRGRLICFTGVSGSGKSSLAFDTIYAEGQRRYVESLSSYARQFLNQMPKPDVDRIEGLSPSISIQQKTAGRNPRSTVGTITEIHDYLRVLFARVGQGHCPHCGTAVAAQSREQIVSRLAQFDDGATVQILAPVARGQKGEFKDLFSDLSRSGYVRARVDGQVITLAEPPSLDRNIKHDIEVVIDRLQVGPSARGRLAEAVEAALKLGDSTLIAATEGKPDLVLSGRHACPTCGVGFDEPSPQLFSFNSPLGMCPGCDGLGVRHDFVAELLVPDPGLSVWEGAIAPLGPVKGLGKWRRHIFEGVASNLELDSDGPPRGTLLKKPWRELEPRHQRAWLEGTGDRVHVIRWRHRGRTWSHPETWMGVANELLERFKNSKGGPARAALEPYMRSTTCPECQGSRLNKRARAVRVAGCTLADFGSWTIGRLHEFLGGLTARAAGKGAAAGAASFDDMQRLIAADLVKEIRKRLGFLVNVGLDYMSLDRSAPTLSGGEAQRIRLASQVGSGLTGVLYILDEPSIGLHPRDNDRLIASLKDLRDAGNTVIVVEHDEDTMRASDHLVDFGPGPGVKGGDLVAQGTLAEVADAARSVTGQYLAGKRRIAVPSQRKAPGERSLVVRNARHNNLKGIDVQIPLGLFVCVTGVSGSGKSSLVADTLREALARDLNGADGEPGAHDAIDGIDALDKIIDIDQSPIGRTPRSNPSTYIKLFDEIRDLYTKLPESRARGYKPGRFSFNVTSGRCEACEGNGSNRLEMDFLADVWVKCPVCEGRRFNRETLHVRYKGKSIADVLDMDVQEALEHFANVPRIAAMLKTLHDVGLDYIKLGQPSPTLSGGEAQRVKLARELVKRSTGRTLYVLDEPTTGLHFEDIQKLLDVLHSFTAAGNTVLVIEHNLDVVKTADWVIDLGPEGGAQGGWIVAQGTPEQVAAITASHTGKALARCLGGPRGVKAAGRRKTSAARKPAPAARSIQIKGASQHNLKQIDVTIPRDQLTICSGPSGSGKSSLAIDTLYAEGQRRYVESLSSYARQFLSPLQKPRVEQITGLAPAICIEQKTTSKSPRSTAGTSTEIHDYLRVLFARLGHPHCPACQVPVGSQTADEIVEKILHLPDSTRVAIMAPLDRRAGETYDGLWDQLRGSGFSRVRVDGETHSLDEPPKLSARRKHDIEVVVDRAVVRRKTRSRLADSVASALDLGKGVIHVVEVREDQPELKWPVQRFSQHLSCDRCGRSFDELTPHHFSFNSALGWCPMCQGLGMRPGTDPALLIPDGRRGLRQGAIAVWPDLAANPLFDRVVEAIAAGLDIDADTPFDELDARHRRALLYGTDDRWFTVPPRDGQPGFGIQYKGLIPALENAGNLSFVYRAKLQGMVQEAECSACMGTRLRDDSAAVRFEGHTLDQICRWPLDKALGFFRSLKLSADQKHIAGDLLREVRDRLQFLVDVGLDYLTLARGTPTLSGGESQRIRLASQLGSGLTGVLYVLDEPTIGLHPRDNARLLKALMRLRDLGNTLVVVEHDREVIEASDYLIDLGPGAGDEGGRVTASGPPAKVRRSRASLTGRYLAGKEAIAIPSNRRPSDGQALIIRAARHHNLKTIDVRLPLGTLCVVTGVSGSGKSTLVEDILWKAAARKLHRAAVVPGGHDRIEGLSHIDKVIQVDQSPIGSTPASNPATYTGVFDLIRSLFARCPEAKVRGYSPGRFSFNVAGGRCDTCDGLGYKRIEMHFLPDVWVACESCGGARYTPETLAVKFRGRSIADVLDMKVSAAIELFASVPKIRRVLKTLDDVGLGYVALGQSAATLSGGEAQRVKLAAELSRPDTGRTLYVLDEPTTGLHLCDVDKLLEVLHRLADLGNTVVVIEHHLDVIKSADYVVDLGPEAGAAGGHLVACGTPEEVAAVPASITGVVLRPVLAAGPRRERLRFDPRAAARREIEAAQAMRSQEKSQPEALMPWQVDGRAWHTRDHVTRTGKPVRWEGKALEQVIDALAAAGELPPPVWDHRSVVRIPSPAGAETPLLEALTSSEWILTLRFHVPGRPFQGDLLQRQLGLPPFSDGATPVLSDAERVTVHNLKGPSQEVVITTHLASDLDTDGFARFLASVVDAHRGTDSRDAPGWKVVTLDTLSPARNADRTKPKTRREG